MFILSDHKKKTINLGLSATVRVSPNGAHAASASAGRKIENSKQ